MTLLKRKTPMVILTAFLIASSFILVFPYQALADTENLTTWTEVTTIADCLNVTSTRVTWTDMQNQETAYLYKDLGVDYIDGDFSYDFEVYIDSDYDGPNNFVSIIAITNNPGNIDTLMSGDSLVVMASLGGEAPLWIDLYDSLGGWDGFYEDLEFDTLYYATFERIESAFPGNDTILIYFYADAGRTSLVGSAGIDLISQDRDYRYIQLATSDGSVPGDTSTCNGYIQNVDIGEDVAEPPTIETQEATEVTDTGITLNGELLSIGEYDTVDCYFEYGITDSYGSETVHQELTEAGAFDQRLTPYHQYHYRAVVEYDTGLYVYGDDELVPFLGSGQASASVADPGSLPGDALVSDTPEEIPNLYEEGNTGGLIFQDLIDPALEETDTPVEVFWYPIAFFIAIAIGYWIYHVTRSPMMQAASSGFVMAAFCGGGVLGPGLLPWATVLIFVLEAGIIVLIQQKQYV